MDTKFCEIICVRICHDLVGATGAISNGVELLEDSSPDFINDISKLIGNSSHVLSERLKFFRAAFGVSSSQITDQKTLSNLTQKYLNTLGGERTHFDFCLNLKNNITPELAKAIMQISMFCGDVMPKGGEIKISSSYDFENQKQENLLFEELKDHKLKVESKTDLLRIKDDILEIISLYEKKQPFEEIINRADPKTIPFISFLSILLKFDLNLEFNQDENGLSIVVN